MQEIINTYNQIGVNATIVLLLMVFAFSIYLIKSVKEMFIAFIERKKPIHNTYNNYHIDSDFPEDDD